MNKESPDLKSRDRPSTSTLPLRLGRAATRKLIFDSLKPIARGIAMTFGDLCEVVIHDFSDPEHSIIFIEGNVTGRRVGGSISEIGLAAMRGGDSHPDDIGYVRNTRDGRILRASTLLLRDSEGHVFGCLCINLDISSIAAFQGGLGRLSTTAEVNPLPVEFSNRMEEVMSRVLGEALSSLGFQRPTALMNRDERLRFIAELDRRGAFTVQKAVPTVASQLQVSRTTVYSYLDEVRSTASPEHQEAARPASERPASDWCAQTCTSFP